MSTKPIYSLFCCVSVSYDEILKDRLGFQNLSEGRITTLFEYIQCKRYKKDQVQALVLEMGGSRTYGTVAPSTPSAIDIQK